MLFRSHPEDFCLARTHRTQLEQSWGIRFADEALAHVFSFERLRLAPSSFGFHGLSNFADVMRADEVSRFVAEAPVELFAGLEARRLIKRLLDHGLLPAARQAMRKRLASDQQRGWSDTRLRLRIAWHGLTHPSSAG